GEAVLERPPGAPAERAAWSARRGRAVASDPPRPPRGEAARGPAGAGAEIDQALAGPSDAAGRETVEERVREAGPVPRVVDRRRRKINAHGASRGDGERTAPPAGGLRRRGPRRGPAAGTSGEAPRPRLAAGAARPSRTAAGRSPSAGGTSASAGAARRGWRGRAS